VVVGSQCLRQGERLLRLLLTTLGNDGECVDIESEKGKNHGTGNNPDNGRLVVIAALALTIGVGAVAVSNPADVSAVDNTWGYSCSDAYAVGQYYQQQGDFYYKAGLWKDAIRAYNRATSFYEVCY
jgi:hypothetical protein